MTKNTSIITAETALRERFNSEVNLITRGNIVKKEDRINLTEKERIEQKDKELEMFMSYFIQLLVIAGNMEIISFNQSNKISKILFDTIVEQCEGNAIEVSNSIYVINLWLHHHDEPWLALKTLLKLSNLKSSKEKEEAKNFVNQADEWLRNKMNRLKTLLDSKRRIIESLENEAIFDSYNYLKKAVSNFKHYSQSGKCDLKLEQMNIISSMPITYCFIIERFDFDDYYEKLKFYVETFVTEISIFKKINGSAFLKGAIKENQLLENTFSKAYDDIGKEYESKLEKLKASYIAKEISQENYLTKKGRIEEAWAKAERENDDLERERRNFLFDIGSAASFPSLEALLKEYYICSMCRKGKMLYPSSFEQKAYVLSNITIEMSGKELLRNSKAFNLNDGEISYIKTAIK